MPGASLWMLLDDIAAVLDDVAVLSKVAAKKTAGVLGDDLALNAQQVAGVRAHRELPVVWAVFKGSCLNKLVLVPVALAISVWLPWLVLPLLMLGGLYLCFEGVEKLVHPWLHAPGEDAGHHERHAQALDQDEATLLQLEKEKIRGAIRTDFILSAEIIVIALGTVSAEPLLKQAGVLSAVAALMTIGVYGLVAGIVKMDDAGLYLVRLSQASPARQGSPLAAFMGGLGRALLAAAPRLMKFLGVAGTLAMFLVGGGILVHGWPWLHHAVEALPAAMGTLLQPDWLAQLAGGLAGAVVQGLFGVLAGAVVVALVLGWGRWRKGSVTAQAER
jgi:predicted DNA repair protein MutK